MQCMYMHYILCIFTACICLRDYEDNFHACMHANFGYVLSFKQIILFLPSPHNAQYTNRHSTYDLSLFCQFSIFHLSMNLVWRVPVYMCLQTLKHIMHGKSDYPLSSVHPRMPYFMIFFMVTSKWYILCLYTCLLVCTHAHI